MRKQIRVDQDDRGEDVKPIHIPEGCKASEITHEELMAINQNPEKAKKLVGIRPINPPSKVDANGNPTKIEKYIAILKMAVFAFLVLFSGMASGFAAISSSDSEVFTDFTRLKGVRINSNGDVVPVTTATNSIGDADEFFTSGYFSSDVYFRTNLLADGRYGTSSLTLQSSSTTVGATQLANAVILKRIGNGVDAAGIGTSLANGTPGQRITFISILREASGTWKITPVTATGFTSVALGAVGTHATLNYINDTVGWILEASNGTIV